MTTTPQCKDELIIVSFNIDCELDRGHEGKHMATIKQEDFPDITTADFVVQW